MKTNESMRRWKIPTIPWKLAAGIVLGGAGGFLYFYFVGCRTGTCPITSNPYVSVLYGSMLGALISRI